MGNAHRKRSPAGVKAGSSWLWGRAGKQRAGRSLGGGPGGGWFWAPRRAVLGKFVVSACSRARFGVPGGLGQELSPVSGQVAGGFAFPEGS